MGITLTNSLGRKKETFTPMTEGKVKMYVCGPTVYNFIHIGNARPLVFFDVVRRYLEYSGYDVTYVMNFTDVDDKIIAHAKQEGVKFLDVTTKYISEYRTDMALLKVKTPSEMPKVSDHIPQIIQLIEGLIKKGVAYAVDGEVFYSVRQFSGYGKLSGKNVDDLISGARVDVGEKKRDPLDFSLWKPRKEPSEPAWESPWGLGRPGWHIECSAMAMEYLGETFDIHGGGMDLIHPHHENEIAQSEGFTSKPFARYWLHNNLLNMGAEKMSKSLGNILLAREFIEQHSAETLRYMLLSGHYRSVIDFSEQNLRDSQTALHRFYSAVLKCSRLLDQPAHNSETRPSSEEGKALALGSHFQTRWRQSMDDDLNTAKIFGQIFEYVRAINTVIDKRSFVLTPSAKKMASDFVTQMKELSAILNVFGEDPKAYLAELRALILKERGIEPATIEDLIRKRVEARAKKDFATADQIRQQFSEMGVEVQDRGNVSEWDVVFKV
jgi:cysteinyl-tRNA synthetase